MDERLRQLFSYPKVEMTDSELESFVVQADAEMKAQGVSVMARPIMLMGKIREHLGLRLTNRHPFYQRAAEKLVKLHPPKDTSILPIYQGGFLFRGGLYRLYVLPLIGGPVKGVGLTRSLVDMPQARLRQLEDSPEEMLCFIDQFCDVHDFAQAVGSVLSAPEPLRLAAELLSSAKSYLETAAIAAIETYNNGAAMQECLFGAEMILKGGLAKMGWSEKQLRKLGPTGHDLKQAAKEVCGVLRGVESARIDAALAHIPVTVGDRYKGKAHSNAEVGHALMSAQYLGGVVARATTPVDIRGTLKKEGKPWHGQRIYPPLPTK